LQPLATGIGKDAVERVLGVKEVFGSDLPKNDVFRAALTGWLERLDRDGAQKTVEFARAPRVAETT
jgi:hypothetical protein